MKLPNLKWILFAAVLGTLAGCADEAPKAAQDQPKEEPTRENPAVALLKESMDAHRALETYSATIEWARYHEDREVNSNVRHVSYSAPDKAKVLSEFKEDVTITSVSDGKELVEWVSTGQLEIESHPPTDRFHSDEALLINDSRATGSLLYRFFAGSEQYGRLVETLKGKPEIVGEEVLPDDSSTTVVRFYAAGEYGNAKVWIDDSTHLVRKIEYDSEPIAFDISQNPAALAELGMESGVPKLRTVEVIKDVQVDQPIEDTVFDTTVPEDIAEASKPKPPLKEGDPVPDLSVVTLEGKEVNLQSFKGKFVLLDFWATWCGPCIESLPHTGEIAKEYKDQGGLQRVFRVVTVAQHPHGEARAALVVAVYQA